MADTRDMRRRHLAASSNASYDVIMSEALLGPDSDRPVLPDAILARSPRSVLLVTTPTVSILYADRVAQAFRHAGFRVDTLVLPCTERTKSPKQVMRVCRAALRHEIDRDGALVGLGGGVCLDIVTLAASSIRRGIGCIRIPTTLIGQIDAAIGVKGAVNFLGHKSYVGCFHAPEVVLLDPRALATLPSRHLRAGLAEMIKIALARDAALFELVEAYATELVMSGFQAPRWASLEALWRAVSAMLDELEPNLYETATRKRLGDMGHTFSPLIESVSRFEISHGEAVAIDLALSAALAWRLGWIREHEGVRIIECLVRAGLAVTTPWLTRRLCLEALVEASRHGRHLVLPTGIGRADFAEDGDRVDLALDAALEWLEAVTRAVAAPTAAQASRRRRLPARSDEPVLAPRASRSLAAHA